MASTVFFKTRMSALTHMTKPCRHKLTLGEKNPFFSGLNWGLSKRFSPSAPQKHKLIRDFLHWWLLVKKGYQEFTKSSAKQSRKQCLGCKVGVAEIKFKNNFIDNTVKNRFLCKTSILKTRKHGWEKLREACVNGEEPLWWTKDINSPQINLWIWHNLNHSPVRFFFFNLILK